MYEPEPTDSVSPPTAYRRQFSFTAMGVIAEETADDPALSEAIRARTRGVTGFVPQGIPAMTQQMMGPGSSDGFV